MKVTEYIIGNAIVVVTRPDLNESEQAKANQRITTALQQFGRAVAETNLYKKGIAR
jgi:hypothetical protein